MLAVTDVGEGELGRWQAYVADHPAAKAMHHAAWFNILRDAFSVRCRFLAVYDGPERIRGILPMYSSRSFLTGRHLCSLDDGLLADDAESAGALNEAAVDLYRTIGARYLVLKNSVFTAAVPLATARRTVVRRLVTADRAPDVLFQTLSSYTRRDVRRAEARGYRIIEDRELGSIDGAFYDEYASNLRHLGTPVVGRPFFTAMKRHLGMRSLRLFLALRADEVVGGLLCVVAPAGWTTLYGVVRHALLGDYVNYLLYWRVIVEASQAGCAPLDLGGNAVGSGSHQFKLKWPGMEVEITNTYVADDPRRVPDFASVYQGQSLPQRVWKQLPLGVTNRIGPILRAELPFG